MNSQVLSVVIGLIFVYLIYSLLGSIITEIIATNFQLRNFVLKHAIKKMLDDSAPKKDRSFGGFFFQHPLVKALASGNWLSRSPSYIKSETFSKVVIDLLKGKTILPGDSARAAIETSINSKKIAWDASDDQVTMEGDTYLYLSSIWADSQGDVEKFRGLLEQWFTEMMDRATGWYKKWTQYLLFVVGLSIAIGFNVDSIKIVNKLHDNPELQQQILVQANDFIEKHPEGLEESQAGTVNAQLSVAAKKYETELFTRAGELLKNDVDKTENLLGLGYKGWDWKSVPGWLLTALAISFGAPFWFDLLNKLMKFRGPVATKTNEPDATTANTSQQKTVG